MGQGATKPGKERSTVSRSPQDTMPARPAQPITTRTARAGFRYGSARASKEPRANSHSRARVSKYAYAWFVAVCSTEYARETANTAPKTSASRPR